LSEGEFLIELDEQPLDETVTALGGAPLFVRAVRSASAIDPARLAKSCGRTTDPLALAVVRDYSSIEGKEKTHEL
jgi:hypothetical protein